MRNKCLVTFVVRSLAPPPPDFNVEPAWLEGSGFEVRNKCLVYVKAVVAPKRRFNIEIGGAGGRKHLQSNTLQIEFTCEINSVNSRQEEVQWVRYSYSSLTYMQVLYGMSADD